LSSFKISRVFSLTVTDCSPRVAKEETRPAIKKMNKKVATRMAANEAKNAFQKNFIG
jgi:hypothetical protein